MDQPCALPSHPNGVLSLQTRVILLNWCAWFLRMKRPGEDKVRPACQHKQRRCSLASVEMSAVAGPPATNGNLLYIGFRGLDSVHCAPTPDSGVVCGRVACSPTHDEHLLHCGQPSEGDPDLAKILEEVYATSPTASAAGTRARPCAASGSSRPVWWTACASWPSRSSPSSAPSAS